MSSPAETSEGNLFTPSLDKPIPLRELLTYCPVFISVANYTYLQFLDSSNVALLPLFFAMPIELGGLGFDPRRIGYIMGAYQVVPAVFMATYFSNIVRYLGERQTYVLAIATSQLVWILFPVMNLCARHYGISTSVWGGIVLSVVPTISSYMAFGSWRSLFSSWGTDGLISTSRLHICVPHRSGSQPAFSGSNLWPCTDGGLDSAHYSPLVVDVSLFLLCGTQSSRRLCCVRRFLVPVLLRSAGCTEFAS